MLSAAQNDENFLNKNIDWEFPIPIAYGPGRLNEIGSFCNKLLFEIISSKYILNSNNSIL